MAHEHVDPRSIGRPMQEATAMTDQGHGQHGGHGNAHAPADPHRAPVHDAAHGGHAAHNKHAGHDPEAFRRQFWIVLLLTIPVVIWSHEVQMWLGYTAPAFPGSEWIPAVLGTIVFIYGGRVPLRGTSRAGGSPAGNDDADQPCDRRCLRHQPGRHPRRLRGRGLWARHAHHGHEPRPLARDALDHAGPGCAQGAGRAVAR